MILGSSRRFKGQGYVCFLDVLGFSNDVLVNWGTRGQSDPLEKMLSIKREMPGFESVEDDGASESVRQYASRVRTASDNITICFGYSNKIIIGDLVLGLEAILANVAYVWSTFILNGYTLRGGIDFGDIYWDEDELIGPAFINAYGLESQVAKNSRVVVSSQLNQIFADLAGKHRSTLTDHLFRNFRKDVDGYVIVDPGILYESDGERESLMKALRKMRDALPRGIIREKYTPLIAMMGEGERRGLSNDDIGAC